MSFDLVVIKGGGICSAIMNMSLIFAFEKAFN